MENRFINTGGGTDIDNLIQTVVNPGKALLLCFFGESAPVEKIYKALKAAGKPFLGCMDAGRFVDGKYRLDPDSITLMALSGELFESMTYGTVDMSPGRSGEEIRRDSQEALEKAASEISLDLSNPDMGQEFILNLLYGLNSANPFLEGQSRAGMMLQSVGGSSGGKLDFKESIVMSHQGMGHIGVFGLLRLKNEFGFVMDRVSSFKRVEGTELLISKLASPRHILEINNKAAVPEYSRLLGLSKEELSPDVYARFTLGIEPGDGERLITSIMDTDETGEGFFTYNDILPGTMFHLYEAIEQSGDRTTSLNEVVRKDVIGFISFDCILCYLARNTHEKITTVSDVYSRILPGIPKIGFGTFSENFCGANINQTETFLGIFKKPAGV